MSVCNARVIGRRRRQSAQTTWYMGIWYILYTHHPHLTSPPTSPPDIDTIWTLICAMHKATWAFIVSAKHPKTDVEIFKCVCVCVLRRRIQAIAAKIQNAHTATHRAVWKWSDREARPFQPIRNGHIGLL